MGDANQVEGRFIVQDATHGILDVGGMRMNVRHPSRGTESEVIAVDVSIRPEAIRIVDENNDGATATSLPATIKKATYIGAWMEYTLDSAIGELFVVDPTVQRRFDIGQSIRVVFAAHGVIVMKKT
jgi:iron(III) transport system ATP-binding protein